MLKIPRKYHKPTKRTELEILFSNLTANRHPCSGLANGSYFLPSCLGEGTDNAAWWGEPLPRNQETVFVAPAPATRTLWKSGLPSERWEDSTCLTPDFTKDQIWLSIPLFRAASDTEHVIMHYVYLHIVCIYDQDFSVHQVNCISYKATEYLKRERKCRVTFFPSQRS